MKYCGTDESDKKEYILKLKKVNNKFKSKYHQKAYEIIKRLYPLYATYEETKLCGTKNDLYLDIFIPSLGIAVEVMGEQHYKLVPHFHQNIAGMARERMRDQEKKLWCQLNDITLIELKFNESEQEWERKLSHLTNE